jgi:membrane protease YdiL (CAAX protease family)
MSEIPLENLAIAKNARNRQAWFDAAFLYALYVAVNILVNILYRYDSERHWLAFAQSIGALILLLVVVLVMRRNDHPNFSMGSLGEALKRVWWLFALALAIAVLVAASQGLFHSHSFLWYLWLLAGVGLAPVTEEFAFRGAIQTSLNRTTIGGESFLGFRFGTLVSAALFSCAHFALLAGGVSRPRVLFEVVTALPLALVTGYIYQRTANLWYGVLLHALGNFAGA